MLRDRNIAFFIDVDNVGLTSENYANVMEQLESMGNILFGKIYGAGERKHKEIFADATLRGYRVERAMRVKRRGRKEFDPRIYVDVVDAVARTPAIDAVCVIAQPTDLVYLYSYLRGRGIKVIALDNADDASCAFIDEVIDLGIVYELKLPHIPERPAAATEAAPVPENGDSDLKHTDELLKVIESLRSSAQEEADGAETPTEAAADVSEQFEAEPSDEPTEEERQASIVDETRSLLERIKEMSGSDPEAEQQTEPQTTENAAPAAEQTAEQPSAASEPTATEITSEQAEQIGQSAPRAPVAGANDSDLIKRIEAIRNNSKGDDEDFIEEIRKLLDGLE